MKMSHWVHFILSAIVKTDSHGYYLHFTAAHVQEGETQQPKNGKILSVFLCGGLMSVQIDVSYN